MKAADLYLLMEDQLQVTIIVDHLKTCLTDINILQRFSKLL